MPSCARRADARQAQEVRCRVGATTALLTPLPRRQCSACAFGLPHSFPAPAVAFRTGDIRKVQRCRMGAATAPHLDVCNFRNRVIRVFRPGRTRKRSHPGVHEKLALWQPHHIRRTGTSRSSGSALPAAHSRTGRHSVASPWWRSTPTPGVAGPRPTVRGRTSSPTGCRKHRSLPGPLGRRHGLHADRQ